METNTVLKLWVGLSDLEKREAIARRLGWECRTVRRAASDVEFTTWGIPGHGHHHGFNLPHWPTNDGLAFTEVWPRILGRYNQAMLSLANEKGPCVTIPYNGWDYHPSNFISDTWSDAICRAAYELLPENPD